MNQCESDECASLYDRMGGLFYVVHSCSKNLNSGIDANAELVFTRYRMISRCYFINS